jgi:uncharacterized protein
VRIAIDIDSTLHHYWDQFSGVVQRRYGIDLPYEGQTTWAISRLAPEQVHEAVLETHGAELVAAARPYPGSVETVNAWHADGHFIHITSHRTTTAHDATTAWLDAIGLRYDELYCSYDKIARCTEIAIDLLVDDSPVNLERALDAGMLGATIVHPWNERVVAERDIVGADDWTGLAAALAPLLEPSA